MSEQKFPEIHYDRIFRNQKGMFGVNLIGMLHEVVKLKGWSDKDVDDSLVTAFIESILGSDSVSKRDGNFLSLRSLIHHMYHFGKLRKVFRMEKGITEQLLYTEIKKIDGYFIQCPFNTIYLNLPYNQELLIPNHVTGEHRVEGIYVILDNIDPHYIRDYANKTFAEKYPENPPNKMLRLLIIGDSKNSNLLDDAIFYATLVFGDGDVLTQIIPQIEKLSQKSEQPYLIACVKFVLNSLLYITANESDAVTVNAKFEHYGKGKDASKVDKKNIGVSKLDQISIGRGVQSPERLNEYYGETERKSRVLGCPKWLVRGHWTNQVHGPNNSLRKLKWIKPYEKGQGLQTELINKPYSVK